MNGSKKPPKKSDQGFTEEKAGGTQNRFLDHCSVITTQTSSRAKSITSFISKIDTEERSAADPLGVRSALANLMCPCLQIRAKNGKNDNSLGCEIDPFLKESSL
jgi:hypothetical protein